MSGEFWDSTPIVSSVAAVQASSGDDWWNSEDLSTAEETPVEIVMASEVDDAQPEGVGIVIDESAVTPAPIEAPIDVAAAADEDGSWVEAAEGALGEDLVVTVAPAEPLVDVATANDAD